MVDRYRTLWDFGRNGWHPYRDWAVWLSIMDRELIQFSLLKAFRTRIHQESQVYKNDLSFACYAYKNDMLYIRTDSDQKQAIPR